MVHHTSLVPTARMGVVHLTQVRPPHVVGKIQTDERCPQHKKSQTTPPPRKTKYTEMTANSLGPEKNDSKVFEETLNNDPTLLWCASTAVEPPPLLASGQGRSASVTEGPCPVLSLLSFACLNPSGAGAGTVPVCA